MILYFRESLVKLKKLLLPLCNELIKRNEFITELVNAKQLHNKNP